MFWFRQLPLGVDNDSWQSNRAAFHKRSELNYSTEYELNKKQREWKFAEGVEKLKMIGAIVEHTSKNQPRLQPIIRAQPVKCQKVAGKSRGFVAFRTPHKKNGT